MITPRRAWPKLSETLTGEKRPDRCQGCGWDCDLTRWQECDYQDNPTHVVVVLCLKCTEQLIEKHPRLYAPLHHYAPHPGSMVLCEDCPFRSGVSCTHPDLKANGGAGLGVHFAEPTVVFVDGVSKGGGKRIGWQELRYATPPSACDGKPTESGLLSNEVANDS